MSLKSFGIMALVLAIIFLMYNAVGIGTITLIFALIFLVQAILFSIKMEYYDKFLSFINPRLYSVYIEKGNDFIRKRRRMDIISYYILSAITGFTAFMQIRTIPKTYTSQLFSSREFFPFAIAILGFVFLLNYISILIMKKSKTANEDLIWNIVIGAIIAILLIGFLGFYIIHSIF